MIQLLTASHWTWT